VAPIWGINGASNVYILYDSVNCIILDTSAGDRVTDIISAITQIQRTPKLIFITHGHPDHYGGVPSLLQTYPGTPVQVATSDILSELVYNVETLGSLLSPQIANFDWLNQVKVLPTSGQITVLQAQLLVDTSFPPAETQYYSLIYYPDASILFCGDVFYLKVHAYLGTTVDYFRLRLWTDLALSKLASKYNYPGTVFYPGHGAIPTNSGSIQTLVQYLNTFNELLFECTDGIIPPTLEDIKNELILYYPDFTDSGLLDYMVANAAWSDIQQTQGCARVSDSTVALPSFVVLAAALMLALLA